VTFLQSYPMQTTPAGAWRISLGDLYATSPRPVGLVFHVEDVAALGEVQVAQVKIEADVVTATGIEHRTIVMPVVANLDGADHVEPTVETTFLRFQAARAREEAIRQADAGDYEAAAAGLRDASLACLSHASAPGIAEEIDDLRAQARRLEAGTYSAMDRKYDSARAMAARDQKLAYVEKMRRTKGK
jgi:hypothetical protein